MTQSKPKSLQQQIIEGIKFFKSQFPTQYTQFKQKLGGQSKFETHLNAVKYTFINDKYVTLRLKILDEILIKLRFICLNGSYLQNFEAFLLERLIRFCKDSLSSVFKLQKIYNVKENSIQNDKQKVQVIQRTTILCECLISLLRFCFSNQKSSKQESSQFMNQMLKTEKTSKIQIVSKGFTTFVVQTLNQKIDEILKYNIMGIKSIYPQFYSVLSDGFVNFHGGSKFLQLVGDILIKLIDKNSENIWEKNGNKKDAKQLYHQKLKQMNSNIANIAKKMQTEKKKTQNQAPSESNSAINHQSQHKKAQQFSQICKQRLLITLQLILMKIGYSFEHDENFSLKKIGRQFLETNSNRMHKVRTFVQKLLQIFQKSCFDEQSSSQITVRIEFISLDRKILKSLILLVVSLGQSQTKAFEDKYSMQKSNCLDQGSVIFSAMKWSSLGQNRFSNHPIIQQLNQFLLQVFLNNFALLINKNKTISSQKTHLLKKISDLSKFVKLSRLPLNQLQQKICQKLQQLFTPNQFQLNKPLIIALDQNNRLQVLTLQQSVPLTNLSPNSSFVNYPITLTALKDSITNQEKRHVLNQVRLFGWFQNEQRNLTLFTYLLQNMDLTTKIYLTQYFIEQLMKITITQSKDKKQFYAVEMSLYNFYRVIILYFYINALLTNDFLSLISQSLTKSQSSPEYSLASSLIPKLNSLYQILISNNDTKRLLISSKQEEIFIFWNLKMIYFLGKFFIKLQNASVNKKKMPILFKKMLLVQNIINNMGHQTYLIKLLNIYCLLEHSAPQTISQALKPLISTLIHRNAGSIHPSSRKLCNIEFMKNLISLCNLSQRQSEELASIYLTKTFITSMQCNQLISLIFPSLSVKTMRRCLLSIRNWYVIFSKQENIKLLSNRQLQPQKKEDMFHANDGDNVTVSNALGVIVLELGDKWIVQLSFNSPRKELLIDALLNLIMVNDQLIFWKRFFFESIMPRLNHILQEIYDLTHSQQKNTTQNNSRRSLLYERIKSKIIKLISLIPLHYFKYSTQINNLIKQNLQQLKIFVQKEYNFLKRQCFAHQRYQLYLQKYKISDTLLQKIQQGLIYDQSKQDMPENAVIRSQNHNQQEIIDSF